MRKLLFIPIMFLSVIAYSAQMVEIMIEIMEVNENSQVSLGIDWGGGTPGAGGLTNVMPGALQLFSVNTSGNNWDVLGKWNMAQNLTAGVNALKTKDNVKLLANPKLVTKSGAVARFMVGGEFPVVSHSISGDNVEWKEYGIMMDITPIVLHDDIIDIKIDTELSRIDPATSKGDYWSLAKRKATSHLEMQSEETMVLAGLIETQTSKAKTGIPILCDIPILGAFFGKTVNVETKTNVLIFITPRIID